MAIYNEIIKTLGEHLIEYNVGAWALFRDQMATEISSHYLFSNGTKSDESLLVYELPDIQRSNRLVKGQQTLENGFPRAEFTYYTNEGPVQELSSGPTLPEPEIETFHVVNDFKVNLNEGTSGKIYGDELNVTYDEKGNIGDSILPGGIDKTTYGTDLTTYKNGETLLSKTQRWFKNETNDYISKRFASTISRFHTDNSQISIEELRNNVGVQAFSEIYGLSHGRNLRKKGVTDENGYDDPYCRVWTWHKQYHRIVTDNMRPFTRDGEHLSLNELGKEYNWDLFRSESVGIFGNGGHRLQKYGVMYDNGGCTNGLVNITPSMDESSVSYDDPRNVSVEHCMFSIENLAWKGTYGNWADITEVNGLSREQKGPLGGRIMWFPPYDLKFNESSQANWQSNEFIGRGEPIYTYANTTRSGTLSFKLLIDHPAILDYWERRSEVGKVTESGTDDLDSKEQEMLRFFAGCEVLRAKQLLRKPTYIPSEGEPDEPISYEEKKVQFFVFYPNNYSGKTDRVGGKVDAIEYLLNGVGTNKYHTGSGEYGSNSQDLQTDVTTKKYIWGKTMQVGGYEMRPNIGISLVTEHTDNNKIIDVNYSGQKYELVKMIGSKAQKAPTGTSSEWNKRRYYYRADETEDVLNQTFTGEVNNGAVSYIDKTSYQLNSIGYTKAFTQFGLKDDDTTVSLTEIFVALKGDDEGVFNGLYRGSKVEELKSIFAGEKGKIKKIVCKGMASSQGNNAKKSTNDKRNKMLSSDRAKTIKEWLKLNLNDKSIEYREDAFTVDNNKNNVQNDSNDLYAKMYRFAFVEITYGGEAVEDAEDTQIAVTEDGDIENESSVVTNESEAASIEGNIEPVEVIDNVADDSPVRYDNEAMFFQKLRENEPFMAKLLSDRIKNFDPVFHSMSPEGYNARLTFLNQCMRQGPTISSSDTNTYNANNLSFGRPPVCVLRIGDFYNTKIIITSMTIDYDPLVWDLNQEGIGVMPMIANVSLNFNFIGGSDLGGPIQRLQNATSFNYYANASVYDNRAEEIAYDGGEPIGFKAFEP